MDELRRVVLASASPRRAALLESLGLQVDVRPTHVSEDVIPGLSPRELATAHARRKADAAKARSDRDDSVWVAADTVVDLDGAALGKPEGAREAAAFLNRLSGRSHVVHTAAIVGWRDRRLERVISTAVRFVPLEDATIAAYVASGEPFDKAGGYGIQGVGATFIERVEGDFYAVMGLPLASVAEMLRELGFTLPSLALADATV